MRRALILRVDVASQLINRLAGSVGCRQHLPITNLEGQQSLCRLGVRRFSGFSNGLSISLRCFSSFLARYLFVLQTGELTFQFTRLL